MPQRYEVEISPSAGRDLRKLPSAAQDRIIPAIRALATDPRPTRVKKLAGERDLYGIRVGDYRVVYAIDDIVKVVSVSRIGHRSSGRAQSEMPSRCTCLARTWAEGHRVKQLLIVRNRSAISNAVTMRVYGQSR